MTGKRRDDEQRDAKAVAALPPTSGDLLEAANRVRELEREKRRKPISSRPFHELADRIEVEARRVFDLASREEQLGDETRPRDQSIDDVEDQSR